MTKFMSSPTDSPIYSDNSQLLTIKQASLVASELMEREVSESNISYLIQYGKVEKIDQNGTTMILSDNLAQYYATKGATKEQRWKDRLGQDLNWALSFDDLREKDTTKHVHRLHPYKGKFIPQLVEYFIDQHTDQFKTSVYFKPGDTILDPFAGSGTTLVQANELGINSIGIDVSRFNCMIAEVKTQAYDMPSLQADVAQIRTALAQSKRDQTLRAFEQALTSELAKFNSQFFPSPGFKRQLELGQVDEKHYALEKEQQFLKIYQNLVAKFAIELNQFSGESFLDMWYMASVRSEIEFVFDQIKKIKSKPNKKALAVILSRTIRSCRATTHSDLATLKEPQVTTYYCWKHKKICKPLFSIRTWFDRYALDTLQRLDEYARLKTSAQIAVITGDSRKVDIQTQIAKTNPEFAHLLQKKQIQGIFTSPPYVGQIDYHEQHAYAYDLFGFARKDEDEIGPLYKGQGLEARKSYVEGISAVLNNCRQFLAPEYHVFLVANDKYHLYPEIAKRTGMQIVNSFRRPVLNRTERDKSPYSESVFHFRKV